MIADIAQHRADIAALCRRFGVRRLDVFGSAARGADFEPERSDGEATAPRPASFEGRFAATSG
jgi:hypothetical protein